LSGSPEFPDESANLALPDLNEIFRNGRFFRLIVKKVPRLSIFLVV
jgi:hypothetical protein